MKTTKRILSLLLALAMVLSLLPSIAFAEPDEESTGDPTEQTENVGGTEEGQQSGAQQGDETQQGGETQQGDETQQGGETQQGEQVVLRNAPAATENSTVTVSSQAELDSAIGSASAGDTIVVNAGTYTLPNIPQNITIQGNAEEGVVFSHISGGNICSIPNGATFKNVAFSFGNVDYHGFQHAGHIVMDNCTLDGRLTSYGDMTFTGCTFNAVDSDYNMWCYSGTNTYNGCTFNNSYKGKFLNIYRESTVHYVVNIANCTFNNGGASSKAALNIKATCGLIPLDYTVNITGTNVCTGAFPASSETDVLLVASSLYQIDDRNNDVENKIIVNVDGNQAYPAPEPEPTYVAQIGETQYETLAEAIAEVPTDGTVTTIKLIADETIVGNDGVTIPTNKNVVLDLNGHTLKNAVNEDRSSQVIKNNGTLTIQDTSESQNGVIMNAIMEGEDIHVGEWWSTPQYNYTTNVITNCGTLYVVSGTIRQTAAGSICYAIDNNSGSYDAIANISGGTIKDDHGTVIRMFCNSTTKKNELNISGGIVETTGYAAIWTQLPGKDPASMKKAKLNITGGTITAGTYAWYDYSYGDGWDAVEYSISGGRLKGYLYSYARTGFITGGMFTKNPSDWVAAGYQAKDNDDDTYTYIVSKIEYTYTESEQTPGAVTIAVADESQDVVTQAVVTVQKGEGVTVESTAVVAALNDAKPFTDDATVRVYVDSTPAGTDENSITYSVAAKAEITVGNDATTLTLGNDQLGDNPSFTFRLDVTALDVAVGGYVKATHVSEDHDNEVKIYVVKEDATDNTKKYIEVTTSYFSTWTLEGIDTEGKVAAVLKANDEYVDSYITLAEALAAVPNNGTIVLLADVTGSVTIPAGKTITLDLAGHTITENTNCGVYVFGTLTINDTVGNGGVTAQEMAVLILDGGTLTINAGTFTARDNAVLGTNGSTGRGDNTITVNGGTFVGTIQTAGYVACGIYAANDDTWTLNGGTFNITNGAGIVQRAGKVNIPNDSTVVFNTTGSTTGKVGDSRVVVPCSAIVFDSAAAYPGLKATSTTAVAGGTFTSEVAAVTAVVPESSTETYINVAGGTFSSEVPEDCCAPNYIPQENAGGTYGVKVGTYVAEVDGVKYESLAAAIEAADEDDTVTLLANVTGPVTIPAGKTITLDLNGNTISGGYYGIVNNGTLTVTGTGTVSGTYGVRAKSGSVTTIESGTFNSQECAVATFKGDTGATINIAGGTFTTVDNSVFSGNGSANSGNNTWNISGGTFNGNIASGGYVACGIYAPNNDTWNITGGTFNITNGAGIVQRAGEVNIPSTSTVEFNTTGDAVGKVGDSRVVVPCSAIVFDSAAAYPSLTASSTTAVAGGTFNSEAPAVAAVVPQNSTETYIDVSGGTFSSAVPEDCCATGYSPVTTPDPVTGLYTVETTKVAQIGDVKYETLAAAIAAVPANGEETTIVLLANVAEDLVFYHGGNPKNIVIDLGGFTLTTNADIVSDIVTFQNGTINGNNGYALSVYGGAVANDAAQVGLTIESDVSIVNASYGINLFCRRSDGAVYGTTITLKGTIENSILFVNGQTHSGNAVIDIYGTITNTTIGVALNGYATVNVYEGAQITGSTGIEVRAGNLNVTGGTITATGPALTMHHNESGTTSSGAAVAISQHTTNLPINVNITGGELSGFRAVYEEDVQNANEGETAALTITGGSFTTTDTSETAKAVEVYDVDNNTDADVTVSIAIGEDKNGDPVYPVFSTEVPDVYCAAGYESVVFNPQNGTYTVGKIKVAEVNGDQFTTLEDAVEAAGNGDTVKLLADIALTSSYTAIENITLDLNGHAITGGALDVYGTVTITDSTNTKLGSVTGTRHGIWVNEGATLTVEAGTISTDSTSGVGYPVIANPGTVIISGGTIVNGANGAGAVYVNDGTLTMTGGTVTSAKDDTDAICLGGASTATISGGTVTGHDWGVTVFDTSVLTVSGDAVINTSDDEGYAISTNGNAGQNATVNITGGTITGAELGVYAPSGTLNISGGTITGATGVYFKSKNLSITGGTIIGNGADVGYNYNGNGANPTGDALVLDNCGYPNGVESYEVSGGTFSSTNAQAVASYANTGSTALGGFVSGGEFSTVVLDDYCYDGYEPSPLNTQTNMYSVQVETLGTARTMATLTLKENIDVNYYVYDLSGAAANYTVEVTYHGTTKTYNLNEVETVVSGTTTLYRIVAASCRAEEMGDDIYIVVKYDDTQIKELHYSVRQYCENQIGKSTDQTLVNLCKATLEYGAYAQRFFGHETGALVDSTYSANQVVNGTTPVAASYDVTDSEVSGSDPFKQVSRTLTLTSEIELNFYFKPYDNYLAYNNFEYEVKKGGVDISNTSKVVISDYEGWIVVTVKGFAATELNDTITVKLTLGGNSRTLTYSPMSYAYRMQTNAQVGELSQALYFYYKAAEAFFAVHP